MEEKLNNSNVIELSLEEKIEVNAGSARTDAKRSNLWEAFFEYFKM